METFSESTTCLICFEIIENPIFVGSDAAAKILKNCKTHLHSTITKEALKDVQLKNENEIPLCETCFDSAWELTQLNVQLETVQKEISDSTVTFNMAVFQRRSQVYNSQTQSNSQSVNKSSVIELNVSCLPANTFLTKEVHQNVQHFNKKSNSNIITDYQPDDNIEITHVKFESCDLQLDDTPEHRQQTTASVDAEISFSNESQDYNQPGLENAKTSLGFQREVRTTSSCKQKSQPRPQLLNKYKDNGLSNSNCASSNSMGGKPLKCLYCEKTFDDDCQRNKHHRVHTGEKLYKCSFCTKEFAQIGNLTVHERIHTGEKPHECSFCKKRFIQIGHLKTHERTHTGEKPYKCSICTRQFARAESLRIHERRHTGEKPYECSICSKRFADMGNLTRHERVHTGEKPYKCSFCTTKFAEARSLRVHKRIHTGEKPFECSICSKRFADMGKLTRHERNHTGEKPYECSFCKMRFGMKCNMKVHERRAHTIVKSS